MAVRTQRYQCAILESQPGSPIGGNTHFRHQPVCRVLTIAPMPGQKAVSLWIKHKHPGSQGGRQYRAIGRLGQTGDPRSALVAGAPAQSLVVACMVALEAGNALECGNPDFVTAVVQDMQNAVLMEVAIDRCVPQGQR